MCSVTWTRTGSGTVLWCNRDEARSRAAAEPPRRIDDGGARFLAPVDGEAGGTWIAVNEHGLALSLLNGYADRGLEALREPDAGFRTRGLLVTSLASCASLEELAGSLAATDLGHYRPFALVALEPGRPALVYAWDGEASQADWNGDARVPLLSSSSDPDGVERVRRPHLAALEVEHGGRTDACLEAFHRSHHEGPSALSPCMHRADAETVSATRVEVAPGHVELRYAAGPLCRAPLGPPMRLERAAVRSGS